MSDMESLPQPRKMTRDDLDQLVELHTLCFSDYFLTGLGSRVLWHFYAYAVDDPQSVAAVMEIQETGRVIGLAVGTFDPEFQPKLFRSYLFGFVCGIVRGLCTSKAVRHGIGQRLWDMKWAAKSLFKGLADRRAIGGDLTPAGNTYACLLVNAVHPESRGWQNSERFLKYFANCVFQMGATGIWGTVYPENLAALILYKRVGWNIKKVSPSRVMVWLNCEETGS